MQRKKRLHYGGCIFNEVDIQCDDVILGINICLVYSGYYPCVPRDLWGAEGADMFPYNAKYDRDWASERQSMSWGCWIWGPGGYPIFF